MYADSDSEEGTFFGAGKPPAPVPVPMQAAAPLRGDTRWGSRFNTLAAIVSVTRRIHDTALLPPHSRTLSHSLLKQLLETTALYSNRRVVELYGAYNDSDVSANEAGSVGSKDIRDAKRVVREYVDRLLSCKTFMDTELLASQFGAAYATCADFVRKKGGRVQLREYDRADEAATLEWNPAEMARIIVRHSDIRSNIDSSELDTLMKRSNWYHQSVVGKGLKDTTETVKLRKRLDDTKVPKLMARLVSTYNLFDTRRGAIVELSESTPMFAVLVQDCVAARTDLVDTLEELELVLADADDAAVLLRQIKDEVSGLPIKKPAVGQQVQLQRSTLTSLRAEIKKLSDDPPYSAQSKMKSRISKPVEATTKNIVDVVEAELVSAENRTNAAPLTLFDIAILGGLAPRTYALVTGGVSHPFNESFFERCMDLFDTKFSRAASKEDGSGFDRDVDLATTLFSIPITAQSVHTSYLDFQTSVPTATNTPMFGAPKGDDSYDKAGRGAANRLEEGVRDEYRQEREAYAGGNYVGPVYTLEKFCLQCLERGTGLYLLLLQNMVDKDLKRLKANQEVNTDFLRPFAKLIGLTIQSGELSNPRLPNVNVANANKRRRDNTYAIAEAKYQLAKACGYAPDFEVDESFKVQNHGLWDRRTGWRRF